MIDNPAGGATREIFNAPFGLTGTTTETLIGFLVDAVGEHAFLQVLIPWDFTNLAAIEIVVCGANTIATRLFDITTYWGYREGGETYIVHTENEAARDIGALVINEYKSHDISDLVNAAPLTPGDILKVNISYNVGPQETNFYVVGLRLRYD